MTFPPLPQPKLVLDLASPDGRKSELSWWLVKHEVDCPSKEVHPSHSFWVSISAADITHIACFYISTSYSSAKVYDLEEDQVPNLSLIHI